MTQIIAVVNTLTWPGAFAIVGCAVAIAACLVAPFWALTKCD